MEHMRKPGAWLHPTAITIQQMIRDLGAGSRFLEMVAQWQNEYRDRQSVLEDWEAKRIAFVRKNGRLYPQELDECGEQPGPEYEFVIETFRVQIDVPSRIARDYLNGARQADFPKWARTVLNDRKHVDNDRPLPRGSQRVPCVLDVGAWVPPELASAARPKVDGPPPLHLGSTLTQAASYAVLAAVHDACIDAVSEHFGEDVAPIIRTDGSEWLDWQPYVLMQLLRIPELKRQHKDLLNGMIRRVRDDLRSMAIPKKVNSEPSVGLDLVPNPPDDLKDNDGQPDRVLKFRTIKRIADSVGRNPRTISNWRKRGWLRITQTNGMYCVRESELKSCDSGPRRK